MAAKKETEQNVDTQAVEENGLKDEVIFTLPFVPGMLEDNVYLSINGKKCVVKRGVPVRMSRARAEVLAEEIRLGSVSERYINEIQNLNF